VYDQIFARKYPILRDREEGYGYFSIMERRDEIVVAKDSKGASKTIFGCVRRAYDD
jgi:hypothetical protein